MTKAKDNRKRVDEPWTKPGTDQPEERPAPFAQDPSRAPPAKEQREREYEQTADDKMDAVIRDTPL
jgi:hypothetical protein